MSSDASDADHSVTRFIADLRQQDEAAAGELWRRYVGKLLPLARAKLRELPHRAIDEEDVLVSVFDRFFRAAADERFAQLADRNDLWQILLLLTERKIADEYRRATAQKRGGRGSSGDRSRVAQPLSGVVDPTPGPEFVAAFNESLSLSLERLQQPMAKEVALLRMEGYEISEIAERCQISVSSVERKLRLVRELWFREPHDQSA